MEDNNRTSFYFNRCDPEIPVTVDDPENFYVDFDSLELRGEKCIDAMAATIQLSNAPTTQLFTGFPGAGKTSELLRLSKKLSDLNYLVIYADCLQTIDVLNPIEYSDILISLGLAVDEWFIESENKSKVGAWARRFGNEVKEILFSDVAIKEFKAKVGSDTAGSEIGIELKKNPSFRNAMRQAANDRRRQFMDQIRDYFQNANMAVKKIGYERGIVLILDNLEKLSSETETRDSARNMLLHHSDALQQPGVHLIYTVPAPFVFSGWGPQLGRIYDGEPLVLPMVKLFNRTSGQIYDKGVDAMREMLLRRVDFDEVFEKNENILNNLIYNCGGYPRDLMRLFRYSLQFAWNLPVREEHVKASINRLTKSYKRGFNTNDLSFLQHIGNDRPESLPDEMRNRIEHFMINHFVMIYGNDTEWYDVHPIIRRFIEMTNG